MTYFKSDYKSVYIYALAIEIMANSSNSQHQWTQTTNLARLTGVPLV